MEGLAMLTRRRLIAGFAFIVTGGRVLARQEQEKQKPREEDLKTVTLIIDGMT
jgi:hypothetical protein